MLTFQNTMVHIILKVIKGFLHFCMLDIKTALFDTGSLQNTVRKAPRYIHINETLLICSFIIIKNNNFII